MNGKTVAVLLLFTSVILAGAPESFARPQYLTNLSAVYGGGSCGTCHVIAPGGGPRDSNRTFPRNSYGTLFENQPDHATDPSAALIAIGQPPAATPEGTTAPDTGAQASPGFGIAVSLVGLFACAILARRRNN
ncbi:MAG: PGF-CTERM sorting domain-containing protein [Candidatus Methanoperedens sp.]|nr:PGF-CTERM sorting domain-containing protein [Candidatus Methanoperedens sp.]